MSMTESQWADRGDSAALEDLDACERAARTGVVYDVRREWDRGAVLAHLGIASEDDTDALAYGLKGDDLATAQAAALDGYERRMEQPAD